jgi:hypothetical protein
MEDQSVSAKKPWGAFNIVERGEKSYWNRIGTAFRNQDGSYNIYLDALPVGGKVQIREIKDDDRRKGELAEKAEA